MPRLSWLQSSVIAATLAAAAACSADRVGGADRCFIQVATVLPPSPTLNIGDTITLRAQFNDVSAECLPIDTTAQSLRWDIQSEGVGGVVQIDAITAHVTALRTGWVGVVARGKYKGGVYSGVGAGSVVVLEPPTADTLVSNVWNQVSDSVSVILEDANGIVQRTQTLAGHGSTCWVTPLSDSVRYRALVYSPSGPIVVAGPWVVHRALIMTHTWTVTIQDTGKAPALAPIVHAIGVNGDTGC